MENDLRKEELFQIRKEVLYYDTAKENITAANQRKNGKVYI